LLFALFLFIIKQLFSRGFLKLLSKYPLTALRVTPLGLLFLLLSLSLFSCSTYQNITGYFNTYYNAGKLFDEAVDEVDAAPQRDRDTNYFAPYTVPGGALIKFDRVIEKCSKLIQFHSQSSWVEGSILMIGKSYVYQNEPQSAIRKFKELLDNFPESDECLEAKLWYARAEYLQKNIDEALALVKQVFPEAREKGRDEIMLLSLMLEAQIYFERKEYAQAAATNALAVEISGDNTLRARAQYQCALSYERLGDKAKASEAYLRVRDFNPNFDLQFKSRLKHGVMLSEIGEHQKALLVLEEMIEEPLKPEEFALADLEIANTHWAMGDSAEAFHLYDFIDTTYRRTDGSAKSYYKRGLIHEYFYKDFKQAKEFYAKAKAEFQNSEVTIPAQRKTDNLTSYFTISAALTRYDSLLYRELHPDTLTKVSLKDSTKTDSSLAKGAEMHNDSLVVKTDSVQLSNRVAAADSIVQDVAVVSPDSGEPDVSVDVLPNKKPPDERDDKYLLKGKPGGVKGTADTSKGLKTGIAAKDSAGNYRRIHSARSLRNTGLTSRGCFSWNWGIPIRRCSGIQK
jgi:tetratricopeptide (TPR) repeat protein